MRKIDNYFLRLLNNAQEHTNDRLETIEREQAEQRAELKRHSEQIAKHDAELAKLWFKINQAEAEIEHLSKELDARMPLLWSADERMEEIEREMKINDAMRNNAANKRLEKEKVQLQKSIITLENQVYSAEKKIAKAEQEKLLANIKLKEVL